MKNLSFEAYLSHKNGCKAYRADAQPDYLPMGSLFSIHPSCDCGLKEAVFEYRKLFDELKSISERVNYDD